MKLKNKSQINAWLEANDLKSVLDELKQQLKANPSGKDFLRTATSLSAQLEKLRTDKVKGIISYEEETIGMNKLLDKVQIFVEKIETEKEKTTETITRPTPKSSPVKPTETTSNNWWKWLVVPIVAFGIWWLFQNDAPIKSIIKICTKPNMGDLNYCSSDMNRILISETLPGIFVTAVFKGQSDEDPIVTGTLINKADETLSKKIQLTLKENGVGYAAELVPVSGVLWNNGHYILKLDFNGKPAGERAFEIFGETSINDNNLLLPFDSIKPKPRNPLTRLDSLLQKN